MTRAHEYSEPSVSETAKFIADGISTRYLGDIATDGTWRATEEQLLNPKGYFAAQRRVGVDNAEFIDKIKKEEL